MTILWEQSFSKSGSLLRGDVGWDRVAFWSQRCQWLLLSLLSSWMFSLGGNVVPVWKSVGDGLIGKEKSDV